MNYLLISIIFIIATLKYFKMTHEYNTRSKKRSATDNYSDTSERNCQT